MTSEISLPRLKLILPTLMSDEVLVKFNSGMYLDKIRISTPNGYRKYEIYTFDSDPADADDYTLNVLNVLLSDSRTNVHPDIKTFFRAKSKPWLTLSQLEAGAK